MPNPDASARIGTSAWQSAVEVRQLRAFLAVVEHGSLSAAAQALGLAQSTVSEALTALDRAVGTPTVRRRRGGHATLLTPTGEALLPFARRMLQEIDGLHEAVARVTRGAQASLQLIANESISTYLLAPALTDLRRRWPKVRVSVSIGTCADIRAAMSAGRYDLGLLLDEAPDPLVAPVTPASNPSGNAVVLAPDVPLVVFAGARHPLAQHSGRIRRDTLHPYSLLVADSAGDFHELVARYFSADGLPGPQLESVGSIEAVKRGVEADPTALGLLPRYAVEDDIAKQRVRPLSVHPVPPRMQFIALTPAPGGSIHAVIDELLVAMHAAMSSARHSA